jgi:hypothetical protein
VWTATISSVNYEWAQDFRIVRRNAAWQLDGTGLTQLSPYAASQQPPTDDDWSETLRAAWDRYLAPHLLAKGIRPDRIVSWESLNAVHVAAVELHLASTFDRDRVDAFRQQYSEALQTALASSAFWVDDADDLSVPSDEPRAAIGSFSLVRR